MKDAVIAHNTIVNTAGVMLTFDDGLGQSGRTLLPENVTVANNLFRSDGPTIFEGNEGTGWTWEGNIAFGGSLGPKAGDAVLQWSIRNWNLMRTMHLAIGCRQVRREMLPVGNYSQLAGRRHGRSSRGLGCSMLVRMSIPWRQSSRKPLEERRRGAELARRDTPGGG